MNSFQNSNKSWLLYHCYFFFIFLILGFLCDQEVDECESSPCQNGGSCEDRFNAFKCYCLQQYTGKLCETRINLCSPSPCKKHGTCENMGYGYKCHCNSGYAGKILYFFTLRVQWECIACFVPSFYEKISWLKILFVFSLFF